MKKKKIIIISVIVVLLILLSVALGLILGLKNSKKDKTFKQLNNIEYIDNAVGKENLGYEWLTSYSDEKPTAIIFGGKTITSDKLSLVLDKNVYTSEIINAKENFEYDSIKLWVKMGYNVAIFRYETFATDSYENNFKNAYSSDVMTYLKNGKRTSINKMDHNLSEIAFAKLINENKRFTEELRFIGNGTGAGIALNVAELALKHFKNGNSSEYLIPNRVALTNPYLANVSVDGETALQLANDDIKNLNERGIAIEMIESTKTTAYKNSYSEGDSTIYADLKSKVMYLEYRNSFYKKFGTLLNPDQKEDENKEYSYNDTQLLNIENIAFRYYMHSVYGSDTTEFTPQDNNKGPNNTTPILDRGDDIYSTSRVKFGVSAWTPTVYTYATTGVQYHSSRYDSNTSAQKEFTSKVFATEIYQVSKNFNGTLLCGFIFNDTNKDGKINERPTGNFGGVMVTVTHTANTDEELEVGTTYTASNGFYALKIDSSYYQKTLRINISTPNFAFKYGELPVDKNDYSKTSYNTIGKDSNTEYISINKEYTSLYIRNCGFIAYDKDKE